MSDKRYGGTHTYYGWTLDVLANGRHHTELTKQLARDLLSLRNESARLGELADDLIVAADSPGMDGVPTRHVMYRVASALKAMRVKLEAP